MINLDVLSLLDILPDRITDEYIKALVYAIDPELQEITAAIQEAIIMTRIKELSETLVDLLAWQLHVDFYEPLGLDLCKKRALVENSLIWHRYKGTKYAVEDIVRTIFFEEFRVEEWYEYGGRPFFFRVRIRSSPLCGEELDIVIAAINATKNERSWLDYIIFEDDIYSADYHIGIMTEHNFGHITDDTEIVADTFDYHGGALYERIKEEHKCESPKRKICTQKKLREVAEEKQDFKRFYR